MEKRAIISIISNASMEENEKIEVVSPGIFQILENGFKIIYDETELSGMEGTTTMITILENEVILEREGSTNTKMTFNEAESTVSLYDTPYGMLELAILTNKVNININENGGELSIDYDMAVAGQNPLKTSLSLNVKLQ